MPLNLVQHREGPSVWDRPAARDQWDVERWLAAMLAGALFLAGMRRRSMAGWMLTAGGGALAWWAASRDRYAQPPARADLRASCRTASPAM